MRTGRKTRLLAGAALLMGVGVANAFIYANDATCNWVDGNGTGLWNEDGNWDNVQGPDYGVPDASGEYACIDSGTANITPASFPAGTVGRAYIGGSGGATLNVGADASFGRFLPGWSAGDVGTVNVTAGTLNITDAIYFRVGANNGAGTLNVSGGTVQAADRLTFGYGSGSAGDMVLSSGAVNVKRVIMAYNNTSTSSVEISGGSFDAGSDGSGYISLESGTATLSVQGSASTVSTARFAIKAAEGHSLTLGLDAGGVTTIDVTGDKGAGDAYEGADLADLAIVVNELSGFNGTVGSTYDIIDSATYITTNGLTVTSNIAGLDFEPSIVTVGNDEVLRLTAIPEPSVVSMVALFGGGLMLFRRGFRN